MHPTCIYDRRKKQFRTVKRKQAVTKGKQGTADKTQVLRITPPTVIKNIAYKEKDDNRKEENQTDKEEERGEYQWKNRDVLGETR